MAASEHYRRQVGLLIRVLPLVAEEQVFALKGGTAINLFIRDLPRLSVDIDLTYLPIERSIRCEGPACERRDRRQATNSVRRLHAQPQPANGGSARADT